MKKAFYSILLAILPVLAISLASCNDDDKLPNVDISMDVTGGTFSDGTIYVLQGDTLNIESVSVKNNEAGKSAGITNVAYFLDGIFLGRSAFAPYPMQDVITADFAPGNYTLSMRCTVLAVDKSIAQGLVVYPIKVVATADEMPADGTARTGFSIDPNN